MSALPDLSDLGRARGFTRAVLDAFNVRVNGQCWEYDTRRMNGEACTRSKSFYSIAPPGQEKTWHKYRWVPSRPADALYLYPPGRSLAEAVKAADGLLYLTGGDMATMSLMSAGLWNATNTFGDTVIPTSLADDLVRIGARKVVALPDRDTSGQKWAANIRDRLIPVGLEIDFEALALPYPEQEKHGRDVNDWWQDILDEILTGEDAAARLREQITQLKPVYLPEPPRQSDAASEAVLGPLELPDEFIGAVERGLGIEVRFNGTGWTRKPVRCPFHDDANPSAYWNRYMGILRCFSGCSKTYLAKEVGDRLGLQLRDYLSATPRIPIAKTAGGTTLTLAPKAEPESEPHAAATSPSAKPAAQLRPPLPKEAELTDGDLRMAAQGRGWLDEYVRWATKAAPASPEIFHEAMGLWLLALTSTRRVMLQVGGEDIYPNLYVLIVAKTSLYRKTTAMKQVRRLMEAAGLDVLRLPEDATPEALFDELSGIKPANFESMPDDQRRDWLKGRAVAAQRGFIKDEASSIFANLRKDYNAGLSELLLQGYDSDGGRLQKLLKGRGLITLKHPCFSFLGATTPVMMARYMTNEEVENGFMARFAIVTPEGPPVYSDSMEPVGVPSALVDRLRAVFMDVLPWHGGGRPAASEAFGDVLTPPVMAAQIEPRAMRRLLDYRKALGFDLLEREIVGEDKHASYSRFPTTAVKVATLLALSETRPGQTVRINEANALAAMVITERWRESLHRLERDTARAVGNRTEDKVLEYLRAAGATGATMRELKRDCAIKDQRAAVDALTSLAEAGLVEKYERRPAGAGRPAAAYRLSGIGGETND